VAGLFSMARFRRRPAGRAGVSRAGVSCLLMTRDGKTAQREPAEEEARTRPPNLRPGGDGPMPPLPDPDDPMSYTYTTDLAAIRAVVHRYALEAGLSEARAIDLTLAVSEVAANTVKHAKSAGSLKIWYDAKEIVCQVHDEGVITDPMAGRRQPSLDALGGHGLWIVNQVCDQVELQSDETGTTIRLHMNLPVSGAGGRLGPGTGHDPAS
jgi:anti-sigma regulatory factor (Ser/Thr protein kinase)